MMDTTNTLAAIVKKARSLEEVRKKDLRCGDRVVVTTGSSSYTIWVIDDGQYCVSGGWFDRQGTSPQRVTINGCTWGGSTLKHDIVAACGLRLEFGNRVITTPIQRFRLIRTGQGRESTASFSRTTESADGGAAGSGEVLPYI